MAGVKGRSGRKDSLWADAIRLAVNRANEGNKKHINALAEKLVETALTGDVQAMKEIGDRLDGKAVQAIEASVETTTYVVEVPALPASTEEWRKQHSVQ